MIFLTDGFTELTTELSQLADLIRKQYGLSGKLTIKDMIKQLTPPPFPSGTVVMGTSLEAAQAQISFNLAKIPPVMSVPMTMNFYINSFSSIQRGSLIFNSSSDNPIKLSFPGGGGTTAEIAKVKIPANTRIIDKEVILKFYNSQYNPGSIDKITITY